MKVFLTAEEINIIDTIGIYMPGILIYAIDKDHAEYILKSHFRLMNHKIIDSADIVQTVDRIVQWDSLLIPTHFQLN